ncbi:MAG: FHA domain-containing protein [Bacteroidales bacterium]|nr:FHA domain-containing protein [Bacteroidales bacterium]
MEEKKTVQYKRTLRGSVGAGMSALMGGSGRRYYILEHRDASKYHKAGESQKIIIDQIELGRGQDCQVRFDETFETVSRRHAAIIRDGDRWKLVQLSTTNTTFLNGRAIDTEWYLQNGDEIQLAVGGPRLGFIVPEGNQSLVKSIKMTERLELFRKQALKPYKHAIAAMFAVLVVLSAGAAYVIRHQEVVIEQQGEEIQGLLAKTESQDILFEQARKKWVEDSTRIANELAKKPKVIIVNPEKDLVDAINLVKSSVYAVTTTVYIASDSETQKVSQSIGTGFILEDGRFVTARHCVEPWLFDSGQTQLAYALANSSNGVLRTYAVIQAINNKGNQIKFSNSDFIVDRSGDREFDIPYELNGQSVMLKGRLGFSSEASMGNDWAYATTSQKGSVKNGGANSTSLKAGTTAHLLGFPQGLGIGDGQSIVDPIYNKLSVTRDGLNESRCIMINQGVDHGNSGGPVFIQDGKKLLVVGIVSRGDIKSDLYNHIVPISNLK